MAKNKLNYRFHDPNDYSVDAPINYIINVFIEANMSKVEKLLHESVEPSIDDYEKQDDILAG